VRGREVVITGPNRDVAERAAFLIQASAELLDASALLSQLGARIELYEIKRTKQLPKQEEQDRPLRPFQARPNIPMECIIALKVARRTQYVYALSKLWLSLHLCSVPIIDLDPTHSPNIPKSSHPADHVCHATAIVLAYAAIEELGVEVRASREQPSTIKGHWNPVVRSNLEQRLRDAGVDIGEPIAWDIRGPRTAIERGRPLKTVKQTPWARWNVRDAYVDVVDAIAHVSWLRSKVAAHRLNLRFARVLSVYDVANAQQLARRVLLETTGAAKIWENYLSP
jgi:hypothetical protein